MTLAYQGDPHINWAAQPGPQLYFLIGLLQYFLIFLPWHSTLVSEKKLCKYFFPTNKLRQLSE